MALGAVGSDMRVPLGGRVLNTGGAASFKRVALFDASGNLVSNQYLPATDNITALAGGAQAGATPLTTMLNRVVTVASANDSVMLPASVAGAEITVVNAHATNAIRVYAAGATDVINALSNATAFSVAATKTCTFYCATAGQWHTLLSA